MNLISVNAWLCLQCGTLHQTKPTFKECCGSGKTSISYSDNGSYANKEEKA